MSTVDDAVEAGARALSEHWWDMHTGGSLDRQRDLAGHAARAAWPILSAPLRELHVREKDQYGPTHCFGCSQEAQAWVQWPCRTVRELDRIDKELGL